MPSRTACCGRCFLGVNRNNNDFQICRLEYVPAIITAEVISLKLLIPKLYFEAKRPVFTTFSYRSTCFFCRQAPTPGVLERCCNFSGPFLANQGGSCRYVCALNTHFIYIYIQINLFFLQTSTPGVL